MTVNELRQFLRKIPSDYTIVDADSLTEIIEQELHISDKHKMIIYKTLGGKDDTNEKILEEIIRIVKTPSFDENAMFDICELLKKYGKLD